MQAARRCSSPDAANDPSLRHVKGELITARVKSITVVRSRAHVRLGAIFLRLPRRANLLGCGCALRAGCCRLTRKACATPSFERSPRRNATIRRPAAHMELERVALLAFFRRLLRRVRRREARGGSPAQSQRRRADRLVGVAMAVIQKKPKGGEAGSSAR